MISNCLLQRRGVRRLPPLRCHLVQHGSGFCFQSALHVKRHMWQTMLLLFKVLCKRRICASSPWGEAPCSNTATAHISPFEISHTRSNAQISPFSWKSGRTSVTHTSLCTFPHCMERILKLYILLWNGQMREKLIGSQAGDTLVATGRLEASSEWSWHKSYFHLTKISTPAEQPWWVSLDLMLPWST